MCRRAAMHSVAGVRPKTPEETQMRPTQKAAVALIAGAIIHAIGGSVGQVVQASTQVSDDMFSYPWTSAELVAVSGLRASGVAGPTRAARIGLGVALAGSALFVVAELASIAVRDQYSDEGAAGERDAEADARRAVA